MPDIDPWIWIAVHGGKLPAAAAEHAPAVVLELLAADTDGQVVTAVAQNEATPPDVLIRIAKIRPLIGTTVYPRRLREALINNPNTPTEALAEVIRWATPEELAWGRAALAGHPNTPPEELAKLARNERGDVVVAVAANPSTPPRTLVSLAKAWWRRTRETVARNPATPTKTLAKLASDPDREVRVAVAENPVTPRWLLRRMRYGAGPEAGRAAREALKETAHGQD